MYATAASLQVEAASGVVDRLLVAPVGFTRVLLAKSAARVLTGSLQLLALLAWGALVFGLSLGTSPTALLLLVVAIAFAAVGMGAFAAGLARSLEQALPIALALVLPVAAIGGLWWPLHVEPAWMRAIADWTPSRWAMSGLVDLVLRDRGL
ncbi:MAG: ABC transporter permease, partial [Alphaproteobacteria bacterium]